MKNNDSIFILLYIIVLFLCFGLCFVLFHQKEQIETLNEYVNYNNLKILEQEKEIDKLEISLADYKNKAENLVDVVLSGKW